MMQTPLHLFAVLLAYWVLAVCRKFYAPSIFKPTFLPMTT